MCKAMSGPVGLQNAISCQDLSTQKKKWIEYRVNPSMDSVRWGPVAVQAIPGILWSSKENPKNQNFQYKFNDTRNF